MKRITVIYGMPCTGKTSICDSLKESNYLNQIRIDKVWEKYFPIPSYNEEQSNEVFQYLLNELEDMLKGDLNDIIVEGVFATDKRIFKLKEIALSNNYQVVCIYLYASLDCLLLRNEERTNTKTFLNPERFKIFQDRFNSDNLCDLAINSEVESKENTINIIKTFLENGR